MSEFTYACPVCHQHIKCDITQGGSVMNCPTCFQKIVSPQAPGESERNLVFTGHRYVEKKNTGILTNPVVGKTGAPPAKAKSSLPLVMAVIMTLLVVAGAVVFILKYRASQADQSGTSPTPPVSQPAVVVVTNKPNVKPKVEVPEASDAYWTYSLAGLKIPDSMVSGRIHGQPFVMHHAEFVKGQLSFYGQKGALVWGANIDFSGAAVESLTGKAINITTDAKRAAKVTLLWREHGQQMTTDFNGGYAMRLELDSRIGNDGGKYGPYLQGHVYLCTSDSAKSYLMGRFKAYVAYPQ
jgi:DNA-directed RNA polymerase subunit RPC12/RpoP